MGAVIPTWYMVIARTDGGTAKLTISGWSDHPVVVGDTVEVTRDYTNNGDGQTWPLISSTWVRSPSRGLLLWVAENIRDTATSFQKPNSLPPEVAWHQAQPICKTVQGACQETTTADVSVSIDGIQATLGPHESAEIGAYVARTARTEFLESLGHGSPGSCEGALWSFLIAVFKNLPAQPPKDGGSDGPG